MIFIAAGSNLPFCGIDSQQLVTNAMGSLGRVSRVVAQSALYRSPAWPDPTDPPYVNAVCQIETALPPEALLLALQAIEAGAGRRRSVKNAPRTLDLDIISYNGVVRSEPNEPPVLPHPRLAGRRFVLEPLCEIAPEWRHPATGETAAAMLAALPGPALAQISAEI